MTALDFPTSPSNGDTYQNYVYDSTAGVWKRFTAGLDLNDITDVTLTSPTDGQALVYDNATSNWVNGEGSGSGNAASDSIQLNFNTISENYTFETGYNGVSAGPITIADGFTVTVPDGSAWSIV